MWPPGGLDSFVTGQSQSVFRLVQTPWGWLSTTLPLVLKLPVCVLVTAVLLVVTWFVRPFDTHGARLQRFIVFWARLMLSICRIQVKTEGLNCLNPSQQYVFVSNHASWIDIPVLLASLPHNLAFFAKRELFQMPLAGACLRRTGQIPIDRANTRGFADALKKAGEALTHDHRSLLFFPAGTRASNGVGEFKDGAAYCAIRAKLPIVPVGLAGTAAAMPRGSTRIRAAVVQIIVGDPIPTVDLMVTARTSLTKKLQNEVLLSLVGSRANASSSESYLGETLRVFN
jgi:1-acyl-sn-glycerol-3-phosphate acyltransferase